MNITRKISIVDGQCNHEEYVELLKEYVLLIYVYDFRKFSPSFIKFTVIELKMVGFLNPIGFLKQTVFLEKKIKKIKKKWKKKKIP